MLEQIDKLLDNELAFSFPVNDFMSPLMAKEEPVPINLFLKNEDAWIDLYLKGTLDPKDLPLIESLTPIHYDGLTAVSERIGRPDFIEAYRELVSLPSVIPVEFYINGNRAYIGFRFHNSDRPSVLSLLKKAIVKVDGIRIEYFGPSRGIISRLTAINSRVPLTIVQYSFKTKFRGAGGKNKRNVIAEFRLAPRKYNRLGRIIYGEPLERDDSAHKISAEPPIYAVKIAPGPTESLLNLIENDRIAIGSYIEEYVGGKAYATVFLPTLLLNAFMIRLQTVFSTVSNAELDVSLITPYSEGFVSSL